MHLRIFGIGVSDAIAGEKTDGVVTEVKTCWWLKINTKPVRRHAMDGAVFPYVIYFSYIVDGKTYQGRRYVHYNRRCPQRGEKLAVYYVSKNPAKYAVMV